MKGVIKALGLQNITLVIHIVFQGFFNFIVYWFFLIKLDLGMMGVWISKSVVDIFITIGYSLVLQASDWERISNDSLQR